MAHADWMTGPRVSVIVTMYNVSPYLTRCLDSIRAQTYRNLEILLIDDGSTDDTAGIAGRFAAEDGRARVIRQDHRGVSCARNRGIDEATGEWITFLDGDDALEETAVETLLEAVETSGQKLGVAGHTVVPQRRAGRPKEAGLHGGLYPDRLSAQKYFLTEGLGHHFPWAKLYHHSVFEGVRYPEGAIYEDIWTLFEIIEGAGGCVVVDRSLYRYYLRTTSITYTKNIGEQIQGLEARLHYEEQIAGSYPALSGYAKDAVIVSCLYLMGRICRAGRKENLGYWDGAVSTLRSHLPPTDLRDVFLKTAVALFRISPVLVGHLCNGYSIWENRT